ncbi:hypothetical protein LUZ60_010863 [Juncus effusus]|nr:hypothetical protein LUZ60_010863 [Juncus effusus]
MESKKGGASIDELFTRKEKNKSSSVSGYFTTVFPPAPSVVRKEATQGEIYSGFNKQRAESQNGHCYAFNSDGKSQGSPTKKQSNYNKEGKMFNSNESVESPYFGSSVHYGGRDFYGSSPPKTTMETSRSYKDDEHDDSVATRGDWWQGSLYY